MSKSYINEELMAIFYEEAEGLVKEMSKDLEYTIKLQKEEYEEQDVQIIYKRLRRYAHTIKGSAGVVGFDNLNEISKAMENVFSLAMEGTIPLGPIELDLLMDCTKICSQLSKNEDVSDNKEFITRLNELSK